MAGSGKKLWKQKGTGRARVGSVRSPIWRHGGTVHGPVVRDYSYKLPQKMLLGALRSALSAKVKDGELKVVHEFNLADHKTRSAMNTLAEPGHRQDGPGGGQWRESQSAPWACAI